MRTRLRRGTRSSDPPNIVDAVSRLFSLGRENWQGVRKIERANVALVMGSTTLDAYPEQLDKLCLYV